MVKNVDQYFPKANMTSFNVLFCPKSKDNQFTVIEEERKLESENFDFRFDKKLLKPIHRLSN